MTSQFVRCRRSTQNVALAMFEDKTYHITLFLEWFGAFACVWTIDPFLLVLVSFKNCYGVYPMGAD
jgi:hypothetical protein